MPRLPDPIRDTNRRNSHARWKRDHRASENIYTRNYKRRLRIAAVVALGGACARCGLDDERVLQLDHINNDGTAERRIASQADIYKRAASSDNADLQLLCANCHLLKTRGYTN